MAALRSWSWRFRVLSVQVFCALVSFIAVTNSAPSREPDERATGMRQRLNSHAAASGDSTAHAVRSIFKNVSDYYDRGTVLVVCKHGTADQFTSIQDAVDRVPEFNSKRITIYVSSGIYEEKVVIPASKPYLTRQGESQKPNYCQLARYCGLFANSDELYCGLRHCRIRPFHRRRYLVQAKVPAPNQTIMQASAIRISGDKAFLVRCNFNSHQDTLYDHQGRHYRYYFGCFIQRSEDFVFGGARSLFQRCWLHSIAHGDGAALVAQGKNVSGSFKRPSGFSLLQCRINGTGMPYLGRAWGQYSTVVYSRCQIDANIRPVGRYDWVCEAEKVLSAISLQSYPIQAVSTYQRVTISL